MKNKIPVGFKNIKEKIGSVDLGHQTHAWPAGLWISGHIYAVSNQERNYCKIRRVTENTHVTTPWMSPHRTQHTFESPPLSPYTAHGDSRVSGHAGETRLGRAHGPDEDGVRQGA